MGNKSESKNAWDVFSDALRSPISTLAASNLALIVIIGFALISNQYQFALVLTIAFIFLVVTTFIAIIKSRALAVNPGKHHEPEFIKGSKEIQQDVGLGYRLKEHYNTELDPTISYVKTYVAVGDTTAWHRLKDSNDPIEARFYILHGKAEFEVLDPISRKKFNFVLEIGDSLLVPDSFWRKFKNIGSNELEMMVICIPRWHYNSFESRLGDALELPK